MLYKCKHCYCKAKEGIEKQRFLEITKFFIFEDVLLTFLFKCYQKHSIAMQQDIAVTGENFI